MNLPKKDNIHDQWLNAYSSEQTHLDRLRHIALETLNETENPRSIHPAIEWLRSYRILIAAFASCWTLALFFNWAAPEIEHSNFTQTVEPATPLNLSSYQLMTVQKSAVIEYFDPSSEVPSPEPDNSPQQQDPGASPSAFNLFKQQNARRMIA